LVTILAASFPSSQPTTRIPIAPTNSGRNATIDDTVSSRNWGTSPPLTCRTTLIVEFIFVPLQRTENIKVRKVAGS
jgi:hypothetical protein